MRSFIPFPPATPCLSRDSLGRIESVTPRTAERHWADGTRTRDLRGDRPALTLEYGIGARLADLTTAAKAPSRKPRRDSRLQAFCKHSASAAMSPCSV